MDVCVRCGRKLSRYNRSDRCQACTRAAQKRGSGTAGKGTDLDWQVLLRTIMRESRVSTSDIAVVTGLSQSYISRLATGKSRSPSMRTCQALCDGLGIPRTLAGLAPAVGDPDEAEPTTHRDTAAVAAAAGPIARLFARADQRVGDEEARAVRTLIRHLDSLDDRFGGGALCDVATRYVGKVEDVLEHGSYGEAVGQELQAAYGELVWCAGWMHFDACRHRAAKALFHEALCVAQLVDDRDLEVFAMASLSHQASFLDRPRAAVRFAQLARNRTRGGRTPRLEAFLLSREANGWAGLGDRGRFSRLARSARASFSEPTTEDPPWMAFFDETELEVSDALSWRLLGDLPRSESSLRSAIDTVPTGRPRSRASYLIMLAELLASEGDVTGACQSAALALPTLATTSSGRARARWAGAWAVLRPHRLKAEVREVASLAYDLGLLPSRAAMPS